MRKLLLIFILLLISAPAFAADNTMTLQLEKGDVVIELKPDIAPKTVAQIQTLVRNGFYDKLEWFRVIDGFIAQTGYPKGTHGKSDLPDLSAEFSKYPFKRGTLGMGHGEDINSANSQFFICATDEKCADLTGKYTAFGQVLSGMEYIDALQKGEPPSRPNKVLHAFIGTK